MHLRLLLLLLSLLLVLLLMLLPMLLLALLLLLLLMLLQLPVLLRLWLLLHSRRIYRAELLSIACFVRIFWRSAAVVSLVASLTPLLL